MMKTLVSGWMGLMMLGSTHAADLVVDKERSRIQVDAKATTHFFTGTLTDYKVKATGNGQTDSPVSLSLSWDFNDLKTEDVKRDEAMISWLGGGKPTGSFEFIKSWQDSYGLHAQGNLTINGVTQTVSFPYTVTREGNWVTIDGKAYIDYRKNNLPIIRTAAVLTVSPTVFVRFHIVGKVK